MQVGLDFLKTLTTAESAELSRLNHLLQQWILYCEQCRETAKKTKTRVEIDYEKNLTNEQYYRIDDLSGKLFGRTEPYSQPYFK